MVEWRIKMIQMDKINKIYNQGKGSQVHALKDVDFNVSAGDMVAISGPSGSGKSTLLHIMAGIDKQTSGRYLFEGKDVSKMSDRQKSLLRNKEIAIVMQDFGLLDADTVMRNVCLPQIIGNTYNRKVKADAEKMLELVGMEKYLRKCVNQLSGGQKQRVAIARALNMNAKVIIADEPTGALDSENTESLMKLLQRLNETGITMIIVTHNPMVAQMCRKRYVITDGRLAQE